MFFRNLFKKNKKDESLSKKANELSDVYQIIDALYGEDGTRKTISICKSIIASAIEESGASKKTDLLLDMLNENSSYYEKMMKENGTDISSITITLFIHYRFFFESVLAIDSDLSDVTYLYTIFQISKQFPPNIHPYVEMMTKVYDVLDTEIVFLHKNMDKISSDYFFNVTARIENLLRSYKDDNTAWNKIN